MTRHSGKSAGAGWVRHVQETSNAMDIPDGLFLRSPREIALGLKKAVLESDRTKGTKFQSAMSMLNWFINRGGRGISAARRLRLHRAKAELRLAFGRPAGPRARRGPKRIQARDSRSRRAARRPPSRAPSTVPIVPPFK